MVIPGIPRAPKNHYRPTPPSYDDRADNEVLAHDLALSPDPYLHPSYAKAFRRPASPIQDGSFDPRVHATSVRRSRSASRRASSSTGHTRSRSVPAVAPPPPVQEPTPRDRKRYDSSGSKTSSSKQPPVHERSRASPASYASSGPPTAPASPTDRRVFAPVMPVLPVISHEPDVYDHDEVDPIAAILQGSTRPGNAKPAKLRKSDKSLSSSRREGQGVGRLPSPVEPSPVKARSAFSRFRFGRSAAGRGPPPQETMPSAVLPPERRPSERDVGEPSGGLLSPASSFVILDGPPSPPHTPVGVSMYEDDQPRNRYDGTLVSRHEPVSGRSAEGGRLSQTAAAKAAQAKADLDQVDELDETDPSGFAWHTSGPYDVVSAIGSQVGSQVGSGSIVGTRERYTRPPSFGGSGVRHDRRYPNSAVDPQARLPPASPYPPGMDFIPEALPAGQARVYSDAAHSRNGSSGSDHSARHNGSPASAGGAHSGDRRHQHEQSASYPDSQYYEHQADDYQDDFYAGQQPRFVQPPEERYYSQRDDGHDSQYDDVQYHRRSRDEELKYVPMRQPVVSASNDIQSHYGHESHYSEQQSHRSGGASILSGNSAGRGPLPTKHVPRSLVMPSPLQAASLSLPQHASPPGVHGHTRSPARHAYHNGGGSRDHSRMVQPQAAVIPMAAGKQNGWSKRY